MVRATRFKSPEDFKACIHDEYPPDSNSCIGNVNWVPNSIQWRVQGQVEVDIKSESQIGQKGVSLARIVVATDDCQG